MNKLEFNNNIVEKANLIGIEISQEQAEQLYEYMELLLEWNEKMNLTAITDEYQIIMKHFIDCLEIVKYIKEGTNIVDVGTGAGFPGLVIAIYFEGKVNILLVSEKIYDREKIATICDKMMWSFTSVEVIPNRFKNPFNVETPYINTSLGYGVIRIKVEPIKTKNITDFVKNNCGGKIYHICNRIDLDRIMKSGLRIKGEKNDYRYFKNKVYFFCGENKEDLYHNLSIVGQSKWCWVSDYSWIDEDDYALLEIDVNDYNIDFYMDGYYFDQKPYIGYTYNYFPPRRIREVDYDELNWI